VARQESGGNPVIAAVILGVAMVVAALIVKGAVDKTTAQLNGIKLALADTKQALESVAQAQPAPRAARPGRPDPNRRYTVNTSGSPAKGPAAAKIKLVEFSDFQ
jgi:protein-disulfide isomerase